MFSIKNLLLRGPKDKVALIFEDVEYTYGQLAESAYDMTEFIQDNTLIGDTVLIMTGNSITTIVSYFALVSLDRVPVIINPATPPMKLEYIMNDCKPSLVIRPRTKDREFHGFDFYPENLLYWDIWQNYQHIPSLILYTTGSTGEQKGVICENDSMVAAVNSINEYLIHTSNDRIFNTLPFYHSYGLYQMLSIFAVGGTLILESGFVFPMKILQKIKKYRPTAVPLVPTTVAMLLKLKPQTVIGHMESVRYITTAGANMPEKYLKQLDAYGIPTIVMYGQTECVRITYRPVGDHHVGSTGITIPGQETFIMDEDGKELPPGEIGELVIRGPHIMSGYLNKKELSSKTFNYTRTQNILFTGDMFSKDKDGFHYFAARSDDLIKIKGEKVSPVELEAVVNKAPEVEVSIATLVPDPANGHAVVFHVILKSGTRRDVMRYCRLNLEGHVMPKEVIVWPAFPIVEGSSKIDRVKLKEEGIKEMQK